MEEAGASCCEDVISGCAEPHSHPVGVAGGERQAANREDSGSQPRPRNPLRWSVISLLGEAGKANEDLKR